MEELARLVPTESRIRVSFYVGMCKVSQTVSTFTTFKNTSSGITARWVWHGGPHKADFRTSPVSQVKSSRVGVIVFFSESLNLRRYAII